MTKSRILIVEDDQIIALDTSETVERFGYQVCGIASTAAEALQMAEEQSPDLVLMDIGLRGDVNGISVAEQLRTRRSIPVIFLTAHGDAETISQTLARGAVGHLTKPIRTEELRAAISIALRQHSALQGLIESNEWLSALLGSITEGVIAVDHEGGVIYLNSQAEFITGWRFADAYRKPVDEIFKLSSPEGESLSESPLMTAIRSQTGFPQARFLLYRRTGQEIVIEETIAPLRSGERFMGALSVFRDLSAVLKFEEAQKWQTIGLLAGGVAHDFNNLLVVILGNIELAAAALPPSSRHLGYLKESIAAGERARTLISQMLDYAGKTTPRREKLDIGQAVRSFSGLLHSAIPQGVELSIDAPVGLLKVDADPRQVLQIVMNLVINAAEAIGKMSGSIYLAVVAAETGDGVFISVRDTGSGMNAETRARIFDPFFSTKFLGRGLGLAAVQGIIRSYGGTIDVDTTPGKGATFTSFFPAGTAQIETVQDPENTVGLDAEKYVLVVDDSPNVFKFVKAALESFGVKAFVAESGHDALEALDEGKFPFGLVLLDLSMPVLSGSETARLMRQKYPDLPICFMSGYNESIAEAELADQALSCCFLRKPFTPSQLIAKIQTFLAKSRSEPSLG